MPSVTEIALESELTAHVAEFLAMIIPIDTAAAVQPPFIKQSVSGLMKKGFEQSLRLIKESRIDSNLMPSVHSHGSPDASTEVSEFAQADPGGEDHDRRYARFYPTNSPPSLLKAGNDT